MWTAILKWLMSHKKIVYNALVGSLIAFLTAFGIITHNKNKMLSEELLEAQNNIEAYQGMLSNSQQANNVLTLDMKKLGQSKDSLLVEMDRIAKENNIKSKNIITGATNHEQIDVTLYKGVERVVERDTIRDLVTILKDTVYTDSILYNPQTSVHYTIGRDTVQVRLKLDNTQYLYIYKRKEYKNKKNFLQRLFTLDWKKVTKYKYKIINTNDLVNNKDVRIVNAQ